MRKFSVFLIILLSVVLVSCSAYEGLGAPSRRVQQLTDPVEATQVESVPQIILDQEVQNCTDNPSCRLEALGENTDPLRINSLIIAEADVLNTQNINDAPTIRFSISDIESSDIESVSYTYIKKDNLENIIVQLDERPVTMNNNIYYIPIHTSDLGSGIMTSAPYDKHILSIKIRTVPDSKTYNYDINFTLLSNHQNPVTLNRSNTVMDSSYYKMDQDLSDFVIDSVDMSNALPYAVTVSGDISVSSDTIAILSNTHRIQQRSGIPRPPYYPWDQYAMTTATNVEYHKATAAPIFRLFVVKNGGTPEEIATTVTPGETFSTLSFSNLTLQGNETVRMDVSIHVDTNNSILGPQGEETFLEGQTICENVTPTSDCRCFYYVPDLHTQNQLLYTTYGCGVLMLAMENKFYPNCDAPPNTTCLQKFLDVVTYPQNLLALVGRDHITNASYTITTWLKGFENLDELGTSTKTLDPIHVTKGYVNYSSINNNLSYTGYIPGHVE